MPETPNHSYNVPDEGEQDWHEPLNENFEQYDTDIEIRDTDGNRGNYDPKAGAKFLATDTETVYLGDGSSWTPLETSGRSPALSGLRVGEADRGVVGFRSSNEEYAVYAQSAQENSLGSAIYGENDGSAGDAIQAVSSNDGRSAIAAFARDDTDYGVMSNGDVQVNGESEFGGDVTMTNDGTMNIWWDAGTEDYIRTYVDMQEKEFNWVFNDTSMGLSDSGVFSVGADAVVHGSFRSTGTKNFVQAVDTDDGEREVVYTATEAGTPHTEATGVAELEDGRAVVDLPEHFGWVTDDDEPLAVQTTPYGGTAGLKVVERSTDRIVVEDLDGEGDYEFSYTVKGTRDGYADQEVVREPSASADHDGPAAPADD